MKWSFRQAYILSLRGFGQEAQRSIVKSNSNRVRKDENNLT